jgi:hypothetical protein
MALEKLRPLDVAGPGRQLRAPNHGHSLSAVVLGDSVSYAYEGVSAAGAAMVELGAAVRSVIVWSAVDVYVATTAAALATPATGLDPDQRHLVKAGERRELPLYQNQVHFRAAAAGGALTLEGRL